MSGAPARAATPLPVSSVPRGERPATCISADELAALIAGDVAPERVEAILVHVDHCTACAEVMTNLAQLEADPADFGRYQLGRVLGSGAMGIVYAAWDSQLQRHVALKLVRPEHNDAGAHARMLREARALARISHPNVVAVYDVTEHGGRICVATELVDGDTLAIWQRGRTAADVIAAWVQAARGLAAAHAGGVVHRDVKPSNVLVGRDGRVRVGDFGLARMGSDGGGPDVVRGSPMLPSPDDARLTATGLVAGTPAYMAPEQARGLVDARSDQFALCVGLGEALTGVRPSANGEPVVADRPAVAAVLARGLREAPDQRFPTMEALADALAAAIAPPVHRRGVAIAVGAGALAAAGAAFWLVRPDGATCRPLAMPDDMLPPARKASLAAVLPPGVVPRVETWMTGFAAAAKDVCAVDRDDAVLRARREGCLTGALGELRLALDRWDGGMARAPMAAHTAAEELPTLSHCSHTVQQSIADPTAAQLAQLVPLRLRLQAALAADPPSPDAFGRIADDARPVGYPPFTVEVAIDLAGVEPNNERAAKLLRDAVAAADAAGLALAQIQSRIELIGRLEGDVANEVTQLADTARTQIAKLGGEPNLEGILDFYLGMQLRARSHYDKAVATFERSVRQFHAAHGASSLHEAQALMGLAGALGGLEPNGKATRAAHDAAVAMYNRAGVTDKDLPMSDAIGNIGRDPEGLVRDSEAMVERVSKDKPGSILVADAEYNLAAALVIAEHDDQAIVHYLRTAELMDKLGVVNSKLSNALSQSAAILIESHQPSKAIPHARRAAEVAEAVGDSSQLANSLTTLGWALLDARDPRRARAPLERALAIRDSLHEPANLRARTRFLLATALWPTDRARARDLARAARVDLQSFLDGIDPDDPAKAFIRKTQGERLATMDRWIAKHR